MRAIVYWLLCIFIFISDAVHSLGGVKKANMTVTRSCIEMERQALLIFKADLKDKYVALYDWGNEEEKRDCCKWLGVHCDSHTGHVVTLNLGFLSHLAGKINPSITLLKQLQHLDISGIDFQSSHIPNFLGSLTNLEFLVMYGANLSGPIPRQLGNLSKLSYFDLRENSLVGTIPHQIGNLSKLSHIDLSGNYLVGTIPRQIGNLSKLSHLDLSNNSLVGTIPHELGNLFNLTHLYLKVNSLVGSIPASFGALTSLTTLLLSDNKLGGVIPHELGNLSNFKWLDLSGNYLVGSIPSSIGALISINDLDLSVNYLRGSLPNFTGWSSLISLSLAHNSLNGSVPNFTGCDFLQELDLSGNQLSGDLPNSVGQLSDLEYLDLSANSLNGVISDLHFITLSSLTYLDMSFNSLSFDLSFHFIVPFQLVTIRLHSCKLGPSFPLWIKNQASFEHLDISSAGISDSVPVWFWHLPDVLVFLNVSSNELKGKLPDHILLDFVEYPGLDLSNNRFEGMVPPLPSKLSSLNLFGNNFNGDLSFLCHIDVELTFVDLSNNSFSGSLPDCWSQFQKLVVLDLSNNNLSGSIPSSFGFLNQLEALYLRKNAFVGEVPMSLSNCTNLRFVDLGENKLSGKIPMWVGERLTMLYALVLGSNMLSGSLPTQICWLYNLHILDLSMNRLVGNLPDCLGNLTSMSSKRSGDDLTNHSYYSYRQNMTKEDLFLRGLLPYPCLKNPHYSRFISCHSATVPQEFIDKALVVWKGTYRSFGRSNLDLLNIIDVSNNNLSGEFPFEITRLVELVSLNFSLNKFHGELPKDIGLLKSLNSLDLSRNQFSGKIPSSLSQLDSLGVLDLSYNNMSGKIPTGTLLQGFNSSSYEGNSLLYGPPLTPISSRTPVTIVVEEDDNDMNGDDDFWKSYYMGMGSGFAVGFWGISGLIFLNRRCRHLLFASLSLAKDLIYVTVAVLYRKLRR
ncbi:receptor-like protein EIX2 [Rutidosis leptorrhynchoides]|uniref:receptor-like protein EIX2 n=1 Tax=Rutidosis leptorrhynchoides TaxID=125765 RepID=UPI003A98EB64